MTTNTYSNKEMVTKKNWEKVSHLMKYGKEELYHAGIDWLSKTSVLEYVLKVYK